MILDHQNTFSTAQAITGTANSTNVVDLGAVDAMPWPGLAPTADAGGGIPIRAFAQVTADFTGGTSVQVQVVTSDAANLSGHTVLYETAAVPVADLKAGYKFALGILPPGTTKRYLGLRYVVVGTPTAGAVTAGIVADVQTA